MLQIWKFSNIVNVLKKIVEKKKSSLPNHFTGILRTMTSLSSIKCKCGQNEKTSHFHISP
jgi:hypothetical protein